MSVLVPIVTSTAGSCLSMANWQEAGINTLSFSLESLLIKPGLDLLLELEDLKAYLAWPGTVIINASQLPSPKAGVYTLVSPYDGSKIRITASEVAHLIRHLRPDAVVWPKNMLREQAKIGSDWDQDIIPYFHLQDVSRGSINIQHGVYFNTNDFSSYNDLLPELQQWSHIPRYACGNVRFDLVKILKSMDVTYIETNEPAQLGFQGVVYTNSGTTNLLDAKLEHDFELIVPDCPCPCCDLKLTRAYLHHLMLNTPLLAQRYLIQHNAYFSFTF